jgi:hypothetical protein
VPSGFTGEPAERQGRLRGVALRAALVAYKTLADPDRACGADVSRAPYLYNYALLLEQASEHGAAKTAYKQVVATTHDVVLLGVAHESLGLLAEADKDAATAAAEYEQAFEVLDTNVRTGPLIPTSPLSPAIRRIANHVRSTYPQTWVNLDERHKQREQARAIKDKADADVAAVDEAWAPVRKAVHDIADLMWIVQYDSSKLSQLSGPQRIEAEREIRAANARIAAIVPQAFCPAKRTLISRAGATEFTRRATNYCTNDPPMGSGQGSYFAGPAMSGQVKLTSQCRAAFANACP